jgi:hypothetical protein
MKIIKFTADKFNKNSSVSLDCYYLYECGIILDNIFKDINCEFNKIYGGGHCSQGTSVVWVAYEYFENNIKKNIYITIKCHDINVEINITCHEITHNILNKFLEKLYNIINKN